MLKTSVFKMFYAIGVPWTDPWRPTLGKRTPLFHPWVAKGAQVVPKGFRSGPTGIQMVLKGIQSGPKRTRMLLKVDQSGPKVVPIVA